jgi:hypothetical protein
VVELGSHDKGRTYMGGMGIGRKPKNMKVFDVHTPEGLIQKA